MNLIPLLDVRRGGPVAHTRARVAAAAALRELCLAPIPRWSRHVCLSSIDHIAAKWLRSSVSTYGEDLRDVARILGFPGALTLNMSYLFACTTSAAAGPNGAPLLRRSLDWPFDGLGRCVEIAWQSGPAGDFYNVTWPGAVGVLSAMAPGRFCAVINQAPMRRRTRGIIGLPYDAMINLGNALMREDGWPPDHLLRLAFETCESFEDAIALLSREPLARPALFTLTGTRPRRDGGRRAHRARGARAARPCDGRQRLANAAPGLARPDGAREQRGAQDYDARLRARRPGVPLGRAARAERDDAARRGNVGRGSG